MPILVTCTCGTRYTFKDEFAGRRTVCPACKHEMIIPIHVAAEVEEEGDEVAPEKPGKGVLIFAICATSAVVVAAVVFLIVHYSGGPSKPAPAVSPSDVSSSAKVASPSHLPPEKDPLLAPPGKVPTTAVKTGGADPSSPSLAPAELLLPFRTEGTNYYILAPSDSDEANQKMHESFRAAHILAVGDWIDWLGGGPDRTPAIAFVRKPFPKSRVLATYTKFTPSEERDTLAYGDTKAPKSARITWLQYQDVGFAVNEMGDVIAIRVNDWPAKPARPAP
jgi:hypothetical protein